MRRLALLSLLFLLFARPARAEAPSVEQLFGRRITQVEITGSPGAKALLGQVPLRAGGVLTRRALAHGERVLFRSGRFGRVQAFVLEEERDGQRGVRVRFVVEPVRHVLRSEFLGNFVFKYDEQALVRAADLPSGAEFSPQRITHAAANIAQLYFRAGYRDALVRWSAKVEDDDVAIVFEIEEGRPTTLVRLEFQGDLGLTEGELQAAFDLRPGSLLTMDAVEQGLAELKARYRKRGFYRAQVGKPRIDSADGRGVVGIPLQAGPRFRFQVRGNRIFDSRYLLQRLRYTGEDVLDESVLRELSERLRSFYELAGYPEAKVLAHEDVVPPDQRRPPRRTTPEQERSALWPEVLTPAPRPPRPGAGSEERLVTYLVTEGRPIRVTARTYPGLKFFSEEELSRRIDVALEDAVPPELEQGRDPELLALSFVGGAPGVKPAARLRVVPREVFVARAYRAACSQITDLYKSQGFLDASVGPARLEGTAEGEARVVIPIVEGARMLVRDVRIEGVEQLPRAAVDGVVSVKADDPLSFFSIEESRSAIATLYQTKGHLFAQVEDDEEIDEKEARATVIFRVLEGPVVKVSRVELRGLRRTDPQLVKDALTLKAGDAITPQARQDSVRNLLKLGIFTSATVDPADPELVDAEKPIVVLVQERPAWGAEARLGMSAADGPRVAGLLSRSNLGGRNQSAMASLKLNYPLFRYFSEIPEGCDTCTFPADGLERRLNLSYVAPQYHPGEEPTTLRFDVVHENLVRPAYQLTRYLSLLGTADGYLRRKVGPFEFTSIVQTEIEWSSFDLRSTILTPLQQVALKNSLTDRRNQLLPQGSIVLASVRPVLSLDSRDDKMNPTRGIFTSLSVDLSKSLFAQSSVTQAPFDVFLLRLLLSGSGYVPLHKARRMVLALSGRVGGIVKPEGSEVIGTKRFFLGGTQTLRGFNEDGVVPQDLRDQARAATTRCNTLLSPVGCADANLAGVVPSQGGELLVAGRLELRFAVSDELDGGLFLDGGNLWRNPALVDLTRLRSSVGVGLRYGLPIGPAAFDVGYNLDRDALLDEPTFRIHFSIGLF